MKLCRICLKPEPLYERENICHPCYCAVFRRIQPIWNTHLKGKHESVYWATRERFIVRMIAERRTWESHLVLHCDMGAVDRGLLRGRSIDDYLDPYPSSMRIFLKAGCDPIRAKQLTARAMTIGVYEHDLTHDEVIALRQNRGL